MARGRVCGQDAAERAACGMRARAQKSPSALVACMRHRPLRVSRKQSLQRRCSPMRSGTTSHRFRDLTAISGPSAPWIGTIALPSPSWDAATAPTGRCRRGSVRRSRSVDQIPDLQRLAVTPAAVRRPGPSHVSDHLPNSEQCRRQRGQQAESACSICRIGLCPFPRLAVMALTIASLSTLAACGGESTGDIAATPPEIAQE